MDLSAYGRVLRTYWYVLILGATLAAGLAVLSFYRVSSDGLTPRKAELWQSAASVFLTERGFPAGRRQIPLVERTVGGERIAVPEYNDPSRFAGLASLYAQLAESDQVRARIIASGGPLEGSYEVIAVTDTSFGREVALPIVTVFGKASTPEAAVRTSERALRGFTESVSSAQRAARIKPENRIVLQVINQPQPAILIEGRKRTLPVAVFLAVVFASIAFAFVLDNVRRSRQLVPAGTLAAPQAPAPQMPAAQGATPEPTALPARWREPGARPR